MVKLIKSGHVTIMVKDMNKAIDFYTKKLGFKVSENFGEYVTIDAPSLEIGLHIGGKRKGSGETSIGFAVKDIKKTVSAFEKKGIKFDIVKSDIIILANFTDPDKTELYLWEYAN